MPIMVITMNVLGSATMPGSRCGQAEAGREAVLNGNGRTFGGSRRSGRAQGRTRREARRSGWPGWT